MAEPLRNLLTDVAGLKVGNAEDHAAKTGVTVVVCDSPATASAHLAGGAPGTRETDLLAPEQTVEQVDAIVLAGGSAFGLDAAQGVMERLAAAGRGFRVGPVTVPIVPAAILFDLTNGGAKGATDYRRLGAAAFDNADVTFRLGTAGAGTGATTAGLKGGLGSASFRLPGGITVAAIVAVNAVGQTTIADSGMFWAAAFERDGEFGGQGWPVLMPGADEVRLKGAPAERGNTTIAVVATDARLTKAEAKRLSIMAHDGFARAIWPAHTPMDGDMVFTLATGYLELADRRRDLVALGAAAASCTARAIARGVYEASAAPADRVPTWKDRFGR